MSDVSIGSWVSFKKYVPWYDHANERSRKKVIIQAGRVSNITESSVFVSVKSSEIEVSSYDVILSDSPELLDCSESKEFVSKLGELYLHYPEPGETRYVVGRILEEKFSEGTMWYVGSIEQNPFWPRLVDIPGVYFLDGKFLLAFPEDRVKFGTPTFGASFLEVFIFRMRYDLLGKLFEYSRNIVGISKTRPDGSWLAFTEWGERRGKGIYLGAPCERTFMFDFFAQKGYSERRVIPNEAPVVGTIVYIKGYQKDGGETAHFWFRASESFDYFLRWVKTDGKDPCFRGKSPKQILRMFGSEGLIWRDLAEGYLMRRLTKRNARFFLEKYLWHFLDSE